MKKKRVCKHNRSFLSTFFSKPLLLLYLILLLPIFIWGAQQRQQLSSFSQNLNEENAPKFLPLADTGNCPSSSSNSYGTIDPLEKYPSGDPPPQQHPDLNIIGARGYSQASGEKYPLILGEAGDPKAPQIWKILDNIPEIISLYRIYSWDWSSNKKGPLMPVPDDPAASVKQIQMIGLRTNPGQVVKTPTAGYIIGGNYNAMVLFADSNNITLKYTREDNIGIRNGYAIQVEGVCVDPNLLQLYNQLNSSGRNDLPAVEGGKAIGTAKSSEIKVAVRDTGDFLDPRSKLDWWQGVNYPYTPPTDPPTPLPTNPPPTFPPTSAPTTPFFPTSTINPSASATPTIYITNPINPTSPATPITSPQLLPPTFSPLFPTGVTLAPSTMPPTFPPSLTPTSAPIIDIDKSLENIKFIWKKLLINIINFSKTILP
jgi:hypothetical protein